MTRARPVVGMVALLLVVVVPLAAMAQTLDDLDAAEARVRALEAELDGAIAAYEETWVRIERTRMELADLSRRQADLERQSAEAERLIGARAREIFKRGTTATFETLIASEDPQAAVERATMVAALQSRELVRIEEAVALRTALRQTQQLVEQREAELDVLQAQFDEQAESLQEHLTAAQSAAEQIRGVVSRQRRIDRGPQQGIYACIFDRGTFRFRDTWGHPRSGGRRHKGTDVFARMNQPVYAFTSGVVLRHSHSRLGGIGLYLRGVDGNVYYYAHLNSIASRGAVGNWVDPGQLIAYNGASGNASPSAPHVHFEVHPGGGAAINPYPWLAAACF